MRCVRGFVLVLLHLELAACGRESRRPREEETPRGGAVARDRRALVSHLNDLARDRPASPAEIAALDDDRRTPTPPPGPAPAPSSSASAVGSARLGGGWSGRPPSVRSGAVKVTGKLPPEVVQRVVRMSFGRIRLCYEEALGFDKLLEGVVTPTFTIAGDGAVTLGTVTSTMADAALEACVDRAFAGMTFPQPEDGLPVNVVFPVKLAPPRYGSFFGQPEYARVVAADVVKALRDAGCTDVVDHGSAPGADAVEITGRRSGRELLVWFVPSTGAPAVPDDVRGLRRRGAVIHKDPFFVAIVVDGDVDRTAAKELMGLLVPAP